MAPSAKLHPFWRLVPPPCPSGEQIVNGTFETGDWTGWTHAGGFITTQYPHTGLYSMFMYSSWARQDFSTPIAKKCIESFGFWAYHGHISNYCEVHFSDDTYITLDIPYTADWTYYDLLLLIPEGKAVSYIYFRGSTNQPVWIDDVSLIGAG